MSGTSSEKATTTANSPADLGMVLEGGMARLLRVAELNMMAAFYTLTELWPERAAAQMNERERLVLRILLRKAGDLSAEIESLRSGWRRRTEAEALREKEQGRGT